MSKLTVIYWSMTGNTQAMAEAVAEGAGVDAVALADTSAADAAAYEKLALGCPAMGSEVLEEGEFEPFFSELEGSLGGKTVALFGSFGWGDGEWMRNWVERCEAAGATVLNGEGVICQEAPDDDALEACKKLGADLAAL
ncbi:MAG: flavodoxin [bacterium]